MTVLNTKSFYSRFLDGHKGLLHFAAHSHHFWPDVSREAQLQYWDDCASMSDNKWDKIFQEVIPQTQQHIARLLNLQHPKQIALGTNTHELVTRLLSHYMGRDRFHILTTTSEFHSWRRQHQRLQEFPTFTVHALEVSDLLHDRRNFINKLKSELTQKPDLLFLSQVFFDSGLALTVSELTEIVQETPPQTTIVIDGYHAFAALPVDLAHLEGRIFYVGGGYKYAQGGEGIGFMVVPKGEWRPALTGWYAEISHLSSPTFTQVQYAQDAMAFMGATQDPSGLYRFNAVWDLFQQHNLTPSAIHSHVVTLQKHLIQHLPESFLTELRPLYHSKLSWHGHFLTFEAPSVEKAEIVQQKLKDSHVLIDRRGNRLRFGLGLYHNLNDVDELISRLKWGTR